MDIITKKNDLLHMSNGKDEKETSNIYIFAYSHHHIRNHSSETCDRLNAYIYKSDYTSCLIQ